MQQAIQISDRELAVKEYAGRRVVTFKDVDAVHQRPNGTARKRFNDNKQHFIQDEDYFKISASEFRTHFDRKLSKRAVEDIVLLTESGYLMLVKSFTDDLAWEVQRQLVNSYFRAKVEQQFKLLMQLQEDLARQQRIKQKLEYARSDLAGCIRIERSFYDLYKMFAEHTREAQDRVQVWEEYLEKNTARLQRLQMRLLESGKEVGMLVDSRKN